MAKRTDIFKFITFAVTYVLACLTVSSNRLDGYFSFGSMWRLIFKITAVFIFVLIFALINKNQRERIIKFTAVAINVILLIFIFDYHITNIGGTSAFEMLWLSTIYTANAGLYIGLSLGCSGDFKGISKRFWLSFLPTYAYTFALAFIRHPNTYYEVNLKLGSGLISQLKYAIAYFHSDFTIVFDFVGNIAFFIPVPFLINALLGGLKRHQRVIIAVIIPFLIEGYQYIFKCGSVDIDDIVFNLSGMIIGLICMTIENKIHTDEKEQD